MIGPLGRLVAAASLGQHCPQMTQRPGIAEVFLDAGWTHKVSYKGCLDFPCYCLCFEPVKARRQKPALMVCPHAGLPG